jgi:sarcosine oxidase
VLYEPATAGRVDAAVTAFQAAAAAHGAVVRHHRRVTAVEPDGNGVLVRSAAGARIYARTAVVAATGFFSPASTAIGRWFSAGGSGQVANWV